MRLAWPVWGRRAAPRSRPRVAQAIQAARVAQTARVVPSYLAVYIVGSDGITPARGPFDARRASAWQAIDSTLRELRAS